MPEDLKDEHLCPSGQALGYAEVVCVENWVCWPAGGKRRCIEAGDHNAKAWLQIRFDLERLSQRKPLLVHDVDVELLIISLKMQQSLQG